MPFPSCPYCGEELHLNPTRGVKCRSCGNRLRWRTHALELFGRSHVTEAEARAVDGFRDLKGHGVTPEDFHELLRERKEKFGDKATAPDVVWGLWQKLLKDRAEAGNPPERGMYYTMALFVTREGRSAAHLLQAAARAELEELRAHGFQQVSISASGNGCEPCTSSNGRTLSIEEALREMPIPNVHCSHVLSGEFPFCRCSFSPVLESLEPSLATQGPHSEHEPSPPPAKPQKSGCAPAVLLIAFFSLGVLLTLAAT